MLRDRTANTAAGTCDYRSSPKSFCMVRSSGSRRCVFKDHGRAFFGDHEGCRGRVYGNQPGHNRTIDDPKSADFHVRATGCPLPLCTFSHSAGSGGMKRRAATLPAVFEQLRVSAARVARRDLRADQATHRRHCRYLPRRTDAANHAKPVFVGCQKVVVISGGSRWLGVRSRTVPRAGWPVSAIPILKPEKSSRRDRSLPVFDTLHCTRLSCMLGESNSWPVRRCTAAFTPVCEYGPFRPVRYFSEAMAFRTGPFN